MPEGDSVFLTARRLHSALAGKRVTTFDLRVPALALADETGAIVDEVAAVGKHVLVRFSDGRTLHSHLRMDGTWRVASGSRRPGGGPEHTLRALIGTCDAVAAGYRIHDLALIDTVDEASVIGHLGPDLLSPEFDLAEALRRLALQPEMPIGQALLDQRLVAGIGNVYKCELLFLHRLDPWASVSAAGPLDALLIDAVRLLKANCVRFNRTTTGWLQPGQQYYVYGRRGRACRRCGTAIVQAQQGPPLTERVLYYCPRCQLAGSAG